MTSKEFICTWRQCNLRKQRLCSSRGTSKQINQCQVWRGLLYTIRLQHNHPCMSFITYSRRIYENHRLMLIHIQRENNQQYRGRALTSTPETLIASAVQNLNLLPVMFWFPLTSKLVRVIWLIPYRNFFLVSGKNGRNYRPRKWMV